MLSRSQYIGGIKLKTETKYNVLLGLFSGFCVAIFAIFCYYAVFSFATFLLGTRDYRYITIIIAMVILSISTGAKYAIIMQKPGKNSVDMIAFFVTLYAASRFINIYEIYIFVMITIITTALVKILIWNEIKRMAPASNNPSEK